MQRIKVGTSSTPRRVLLRVGVRATGLLAATLRLRPAAAARELGRRSPPLVALRRVRSRPLDSRGAHSLADRSQAARPAVVMLIGLPSRLSRGSREALAAALTASCRHDLRGGERVRFRVSNYMGRNTLLWTRQLVCSIQYARYDAMTRYCICKNRKFTDVERETSRPRTVQEKLQYTHTTQT